MAHRQDITNLPIDGLRALVAVQEAGGNYSKAAEVIGITQPGLSSQIKRLQVSVGQQLFELGANGRRRLTKEGELVLLHARHILSVNDEIVSWAKRAKPNQVRVGVPRWVSGVDSMALYNECMEAYPSKAISILCSSAEHLQNELQAGRLEVALLSDPGRVNAQLLEEWFDQMYWVRSSRIQIRGDKPVPLVSWIGGVSDQYAVKALEASGNDFFVTFSSADWIARRAAVEAGLGVMVSSEATLNENLAIVTELDLPKLPLRRRGIYARQGAESQATARLSDFMQTKFGKKARLNDRDLGSPAKR